MPNNADEYKIVKVRGTGGSLTALPIIETLLGDVSAYVPTNVISITDGQIYLESTCSTPVFARRSTWVFRFRAWAARPRPRPCARWRAACAWIWPPTARWLPLPSSALTWTRPPRQQLNRGQRLQEVLKQPQYEPYQLDEEVILLFAGTNGFADQIPVERCAPGKEGVLRYMETSYPEISRDIVEKKQITPETEARCATRSRPST
jgi:F-type H+/Na+-transporting ATPase subunit alpha